MDECLFLPGRKLRFFGKGNKNPSLCVLAQGKIAILKNAGPYQEK